MKTKSKFKFVWSDSNSTILEAPDIESAVIKAAANRIIQGKNRNILAAFAEDGGKYHPVKVKAVVIQLAPLN